MRVPYTAKCIGEWTGGIGSCRLISVQPLIGLTIRAFSIGSALWVLDRDVSDAKISRSADADACGNICA